MLLNLLPLAPQNKDSLLTGLETCEPFNRIGFQFRDVFTLHRSRGSITHRACISSQADLHDMHYLTVTNIKKTCNLTD